MVKLGNHLLLDRCPHCSIDKPSLGRFMGPVQTARSDGRVPRTWSAYTCNNCGGAVLAGAIYNDGLNVHDHEAKQIYPNCGEVHGDIPDHPRRYLQQAHDSLHAPDGAVMLAASAVDAMLKEKEYDEGSLYVRIEQAVADGLITDDMARWAHQVRLDANDPRHADADRPHHDEEGARLCVEFAATLAHILFVVPERVTRGLGETADDN